MPAPTAKSSGSLLYTYSKDKFCHLAAQLPSYNVTVELVGIFFSEANSTARVLERYYFDRLHTSWLAISDNVSIGVGLGQASRDLVYFPALLFQVLAVALQYLPPDTTSARDLELKDSVTCDKLSQRYSMLSVEIMALLGRHDSALTAVQNDLVRALWLKNCSRGTEAWYVLGDAIRSVHSLRSGKKHA